jgi:alpha-L-rhamnosidase
VNRISYSPFNQYFVIQAMAAMKKYDDALSAVKDCWGGQINYGGTTFFEVYRPSWNAVLGANDAVPNNQCGYTSLAHPWGAGVTKWLSEEVLGIKPTGPGFGTYDILPHLGRTLTSVTGKVLTPHGDISASFNVSTGADTVIAPSGTLGRFGIPKVEKNVNTVYINGILAWDGVYHSVAGIGGASADGEFVYFTGVQPGTYNISVTYSGTTPSYTEPASNYPAVFVREDTTTSGNWGGVYGSDGYVLCNYNGAGSDVRSLPSYVTSLIYTKNINCQWAVGVSDSRAPALNSGNGYPRNVGCIFTNDPNACWQTMTVDVGIGGTQNYQVAFYFVDWDNKGRRVAVEMFDSQSKKLVTPVKIVRDFYGGKYLVYSYNKSARFRIDQVRGDNATLSGIFFD